jgi:hypothetical protein
MRVGRSGKPYPVREAGGRHVRGKGYQGDLAKHNAAVALGWTLLYLTSAQLEEDPNEFMDLLREILDARSGKFLKVTPTTVTERSAMLAWLLAVGVPVTSKMVAEQLDLSRGYARKLLKKMEVCLPIKREGFTWRRV